MQKQVYIMMIIESEAEIEYTNNLRQSLTTNGSNVFSVNTMEEAKDCVGTYPINVIIICNHHDVASFINIPIPDDKNTNPIYCLLTHNPNYPDYAEDIAIILPLIDPQFITREIRKHLELNTTLKSLKMHHDELTLLKNAIVRNVSHELKTPLLQVKSAVALIAEDMADDRLSQMAVQSTARLEAIIKNITLLADSMNGSIGPVLVHESIDQAIRNLRRIWVRKNATSRIVLKIEENIPPVMADKQGLGIVIQQLLDNALKFSEDVVQMNVKFDTEGVHIVIEDSGIGIAEDKIKHIFDSFYQIDSSTTRPYGGTGVGLSIVRIIMDKHDIEIKVDSTLGKGSTFSFTLPQAQL